LGGGGVCCVFCGGEGGGGFVFGLWVAGWCCFCCVWVFLGCWVWVWLGVVVWFCFLFVCGGFVTIEVGMLCFWFWGVGFVVVLGFCGGWGRFLEFVGFPRATLPYRKCDAYRLSLRFAR